jgi:hypothetical protein
VRWGEKRGKRLVGSTFLLYHTYYSILPHSS